MIIAYRRFRNNARCTETDRVWLSRIKADGSIDLNSNPVSILKLGNDLQCDSKGLSSLSYVIGRSGAGLLLFGVRGKIAAWCYGFLL
jgi:hypothetical protein